MQNKPILKFVKRVFFKYSWNERLWWSQNIALSRSHTAEWLKLEKVLRNQYLFSWITTLKKIVLDHFCSFPICQFCHFLSLFAQLKLIKSNEGLFLVHPRFHFHSFLAMKMLPKSMKMQIKLSKVKIKCNVAFLFFVILGNYSHINWLPSMLLNFWLTCYKISYSYLRHGTLLLSFVSEISLAFPT